MVGVIGRIFTVIGVVLLIVAWLWWLYVYRTAAAIDCLYVPGKCEALKGLAPIVTLPPYDPKVLWAGAAAALLGTVLRLVSRG
ncbi:MAG: hypothetical protein WBP94_03020 [Rhodomicrobiaceae bacterium]